VLLASCASSVFTILGLVGYFIWLPKYFEHEFRISKSQASMYSGNRSFSKIIILKKKKIQNSQDNDTLDILCDT